MHWTSISLLCASALCSLLSAECIRFNDAKDHIGETRCVTGKVLRVEVGERGVHYLDFCEDYRVCSFTVVSPAI